MPNLCERNVLIDDIALRAGQCGEGVQTEEHVLVGCNLTKGIREKYGETSVCFKSFMNDKKSKAQLHMLHEILDLLED